MNIYVRELKANYKSLIIWTFVIIGLIVMEMQEYSSFIDDGKGMADFLKMIDNMPKFIQTMWGTSSIDITTPLGYFNALFPYVALMAGIHAGMLGSNIIVKEERDKTVEFLMTKPVSRVSIITSKIMASLTNLTILNLGTFITFIIIIKGLVNEPIAKEMIMGMVSMLLIQVLFLIIGIFISAINKNTKKAGSLTMGILLSSFVLSFIVDMSSKFEFLRILTPFKYFEAKEFLIEGHINLWYTILTFILITIMLAITYHKYPKRDLNI